MLEIQLTLKCKGLFVHFKWCNVMLDEILYVWWFYCCSGYPLKLVDLHWEALSPHFLSSRLMQWLLNWQIIVLFLCFLLLNTIWPIGLFRFVLDSGLVGGVGLAFIVILIDIMENLLFYLGVLILILILLLLIEGILIFFFKHLLRVQFNFTWAGEKSVIRQTYI